MIEKVFVAIYQDGPNRDMNVFLTKEDAKEWRRELAEQNWTTLVPEDVKRPQDRERMANIYWKYAAELVDGGEFGEYFTIHECKIRK